MSLPGAIVSALLGSIICAAGFGVILAFLAGDGDMFEVVVIAVAALALFCVLPFALASLRSVRKRAVRRLAVFFAVVLAIAAFGLSAAHLGAQGTVASALPGMMRLFVLLAAGEVVVLVYWFVFRHEAEQKARPAIRFGRAGAMNGGETR